MQTDPQLALALDDAGDFADALQRYDRAAIPRGKVTRTAEGYLRIEGLPIARIGAQEYLNADGTTRTELRLPEDVFAEDALRSGERQPITLDHPFNHGGEVNAGNARELAVGAVSNLRADSAQRYVLGDATVYAQDAIDAIEAGSRDLSVGYRFRKVMLPDGVFRQDGHALDGTAADLRQTRIRINHVAIVAKGRANVGDPNNAVRIRLDAAGNQPGLPGDPEISMSKKSIQLGKKRFDVADDLASAFDASLSIGNDTFDVPEPVKAYVESIRADMARLKSGALPEGSGGPLESVASVSELRAELAAARAERSTAEARADKAEGQCDALKSKLDEAQKAADAAPEQTAEQRADHFDLVERVAKATGEKGRDLVALDADALRLKLAEKLTGKALDGKSAEYIAGVLEMAEAKPAETPAHDTLDDLAKANPPAVKRQDAADESPLTKAVNARVEAFYNRTEAKA